jgi:hypothetical protein
VDELQAVSRAWMLLLHVGKIRRSAGETAAPLGVRLARPVEIVVARVVVVGAEQIDNVAHQVGALEFGHGGAGGVWRKGVEAVFPGVERRPAVVVDAAWPLRRKIGV